MRASSARVFYVYRSVPALQNKRYMNKNNPNKGLQCPTTEDQTQETWWQNNGVRMEIPPLLQELGIIRLYRVNPQLYGNDEKSPYSIDYFVVYNNGDSHYCTHTKGYSVYESIVRQSSHKNLD